MKEIQTQMKRIFPVHLLLAKKQFLNFKTLLLRFKKLVCEATQLIQHTVVNYSSLHDPQGPPPGSATGGGKYLMYDHADIRDIFIFVVNSRWKKIEEEKNALDAMKQSLEKEGGKINRVLLV